MHQGSRQLAGFGHGQVDSLTQFPATLWLEAGARSARLLDATLAVAGETHRALLQATEAQVCLFDEVVSSLAGQTALGTPWESRFALAALRTTLETAERTMHAMGTASAESLALAGAEAHQISEHLKENAPTTWSRLSSDEESPRFARYLPSFSGSRGMRQVIEPEAGREAIVRPAAELSKWSSAAPALP